MPNVQYRFEDEIGFLLGREDFQSVGYGRGGLWIRLVEGFSNQEILSKLIGNYGLGNPENQFLGVLFWFGYVGLAAFVFLIIYLTVALLREAVRVKDDATFLSNIKFMLISILVGGYWFAGTR